MSRTPPPAPKRRFWRKLFAGLAFLSLLLAVLGLSLAPAVEPAPAPTAAQIKLARDAFDQVRDISGKDTPGTLSLSWEQVDATALLGARLSGYERTRVEGDADGVLVHSAIKLSLGLWANVSATIPPDAEGFPPISGRIGRLPLPPFLMRGLMGIARQLVSLKGAHLPAPDAMLQGLTLTTGGLRATLHLPSDGKMFRDFATARASGVEGDDVLRIYCRLASQQSTQPSPLLADHVRRAFHLVKDGAGTPEANRAALVALAMLVVTPEVGKIAAIAPEEAQTCSIPSPDPRLLERADLAKHWALSAALSSVFGPDISQAMGQWKEVADSGVGGSGFSFIDLAADRSGIAIARRATEPERAETMATAMQNAADETLLPIRALALAEGLDEAAFSREYESTDSATYARMIRQIDALLARRE